MSAADWGSARWDDTADDTAPSSTLAAIDTAAPDLPALAERANRYHVRAQELAHGALEVAWYAGNALLAAKAQCRHGEWLGWLADNFKGSERTAQNYMRLANTQTSADLDPDQSIDGAIKALCKTKPAPPQDTEEQEPPEQEPPEHQAAQQDSPEQPKPEPKRQPLSRDYSDEVDLLVNGVNSFVGMIEKIMDDERYPRARKRIIETELPRLEHCVSLLEVIKDELAR
jgi:hypothetical protein